MSRAGWHSSTQDSQTNTTDMTKKKNQFLAIQDVAKGIDSYGQAQLQSTLFKTLGNQLQKQSALEAANIRKSGNSLLSANRLAAAYNGVDSNTGSAALINAQLTRDIESDASQKLLEGNIADINAWLKANCG